MNLKDLENQYLLAKQKYYEGNPTMSDYEFDLLEENLNSLNSQVTKIVGSQSLKDAKFHHLSPMLSLNKIQVHHKDPFPYDKFLLWYESANSNTELEATPKFDGSSCNLIYNNGNLEWALTRGDKERGQNILDKMKLIVPNQISLKGKIEIRGEVVISIKTFEEKYSKDYKNPRNFVSGILGRDDVSQSIIKDFHFVAFEIRSHESKTEFVKDTHKILKNEGFITAPLISIFNHKDFQKIYNEFANYRKSSPYQLDGIVIKFPTEERNKIGETSHHPKWAIAIKFPPLESIATIKNIIWSPGVSGEFTPIAELDPIDLDGTTVSNVNLHNYGNVIRQGLFPGSQVIVVKSGDIIPIVQKVVKSADGKIEDFIPKSCTTPECKIEVQGQIHLVCSNPNCENRIINRLGRGIGCFGFRNIASSTIKKLYRAGIKTIHDVFDNSKFNESVLIQSGEFKKGRQLDIVIQSRNNPERKITLPRLIASISFDNVGTSTAIQISKLFEGKEPNWSGLSYAAYSPFLNKQSEEYQSVLSLIEILKSNGFEIQSEEPEKIIEGSINFELTGSPKDFGFKTKEEFINLIKSHGYVHTGLDRTTHVLITDDINSSSSKMAKAKKLGVEIKSYESILNSLK